jgi:hypothetical protein
MDGTIPSKKEEQATLAVGPVNVLKDRKKNHGLGDEKGAVGGERERPAPVKPYSPPLPPEVVEMIVQHIPVKDLLSAAAVSRSWKDGCQK